jgi:hypothetical protein
MVCKDLQKKTYPLLPPKIYTPPALQQAVNTQPGITYAQVTKNSYIRTQIENIQYTNQSHQQNSNIHGFLKRTMLNIFTTVLNKLK